MFNDFLYFRGWPSLVRRCIRVAEIREFKSLTSDLVLQRAVREVWSSRKLVTLETTSSNLVQPASFNWLLPWYSVFVRMKYTKEALIEAVKKSTSVSGVLRLFGKDAHSGSLFKWVRERIRSYEIDTSHFTGARANLGKVNLERKSAKDIFAVTEGTPRSSYLKRALIDVGVPYQCSNPECKCPGEWFGKPLTLEVDHIDGDRRNNNQDNLRFLCPNCHAQTPTYGIKKKKRVIPTCIECGNLVSKSGIRCDQCSGLARRGKHTRIKWPPIAELLTEIENSSRNAVAKRLGVSFHAVVKHLKSNLV